MTVPVLEGKTIAIVGMGDGLGTSCARLALRDGANIIAMARDADKLTARAGEIDPRGGSTMAIEADITDPISVRRAAEAGAGRFGSIDGVVNVAALDSHGGTFESLDEDAWHKNLSVNVIGTVSVVRAFAEAMPDGGSIVLIGSQAALTPSIDFPTAAYGAAKAALLSASRDWARDLGPRGIRVNTVIPSWMWGPNVEMYCAWQASERGMTPHEVKAELEARNPLRAIATTDDVAESAVFLLSDRASMITGQQLMVNAGEYFG